MTRRTILYLASLMTAVGVRPLMAQTHAVATSQPDSLHLLVAADTANRGPAIGCEGKAPCRAIVIDSIAGMVVDTPKVTHPGGLPQQTGGTIDGPPLPH